MQANGTVVPGLGSRHGHRQIRGGDRGGKRVKGEYNAAKAAWIHPHAVAARKAMIERASARIVH